MDFAKSSTQSPIPTPLISLQKNQDSFLNLKKFLSGMAAQILCYPLELSKVQTILRPGVNPFRSIYPSLYHQRLQFLPIIPHITKSTIYLFCVESSQKIETAIKIDINNQGLYRNVQSSFIPVFVGQYMTNVQENIKITQINRIFEKVRIGDNNQQKIEENNKQSNCQVFKQDLLEIVNRKQVQHGVLQNIFTIGGIVFFEELYYRMFKQGMLQKDPEMKISQRTEIGLRGGSFFYAIYWMFQVEKFRVFYVMRYLTMPSDVKYGNKFYWNEAKEIFYIMKGQGYKNVARGTLPWAVQLAMARAARMYWDLNDESIEK